MIGSRFATRCTLVACATLFAVVGSTPRAYAQAPLRSVVFPADSARSRKTGVVVQRSIVDTLTSILAKLEMHETTVPAGAAPHAPHRHAHEELMIVRSGVIDALQGMVTRRAQIGDIVFMASNEWHGVTNPGPGPATYLVIRMDPHDLPPDAQPTSPPPRQ